MVRKLDSMFKKAKWIWINKENNTDEYGHFKTHFDYESGKANLKISCDGNYIAYLNDKVISYGQYPDYPFYKTYKDIDISDFCAPFETNVLEIVVWHYGITYSSIYYPSKPGLIFEVTNEDNVLTYSCKKTLSKLHDHFKSYQNKKITTQLGLSFYYDARGNNKDFEESVEVHKELNFVKCPIKEFDELEDTPSILVKEDTNSVIFDLENQYVGFLNFEIESSEDQEILIAYGENLVDRNVNHIIDDRDFSITYYAKKGKNTFINYLFKFGGRYFQIYFKHPIKIYYLGLKPIVYPVIKKNDIYLEGLRKKIYNVSLKTLQNCMLEHYVDSPWREQALYTMDSRNQMICSYYAFDEFEYQRSNLILISKGQRETGILDLTFPSKIEITIPSFSLVYIISVYEYIKYSNDFSLLDEVFNVCKKIIECFESKIDENGLIPHFDLPNWNFYEWSEGSDAYNELIGQKGDIESKNVYSIILNCFFLHTINYYKKLCHFKNIDYYFDVEKMKKAIHKMFFNKKDGLYRLTTHDDRYSILGNSMAILAKVPNEDLIKNMIDKMQKSDGLIPITLSMKCYYYDALLSVSINYRNYILEDIDRTYAYMLEKGATTFWETIKGKEDFDGAGSLCHGWSALPIYYYHTLLKKGEE